MASQALAQMLDELMGRDRNLNPTEKRTELKWNDPEASYFVTDIFELHLAGHNTVLPTYDNTLSRKHMTIYFAGKAFTFKTWEI